MFVDESKEVKELRKELKAYFAKIITPEVFEGCHAVESGQIFRDTVRQIGEDGWLALGWPKEYGGQGRSQAEQLAFLEEAYIAGAPIPFVTLGTVGPALMEHGSEEHKKAFLPKIARGEIHFAIGYTEPGAGTDLASLTTSAEIDGDDFVINGTKVFTSGADNADYIWLAARTDKEAPKHKGISMIIVPTTAEGFSYAHIQTVGAVPTCMSYYDNVRVPQSNLVGQLNKGWHLITSQLNHERVGLAAIGVWCQRDFQFFLDWTREELQGGNRVIDEEWVQSGIAECYARLKAMRIINSRMIYQMQSGAPDPAYSSAMKIYVTESAIECYRLMLDVVGAAGLIRRKHKGCAVQGRLEEGYRKCQTMTFGGGVNEVQRELVTMFGLKVARAARG
ncbi:MAG: acyl-CoA dehydrogenase family protein [Pseudomonadales bacterium]|nr:acyl-CoA dehydrogenase family protein [Pseudomonadales bacterium]